MIQDIVGWVEQARQGPQQLTAYLTSSQPSATAFPRSIIYDRTTGLPAVSDEAGNWAGLASSAKVYSGTYTPTLTSVANLDGSTAFQCQYMRVGSVVTVSGKVSVNPTLAATSTQLGISLPIASDITAAEGCSGAAAASGIAAQVAAILGDATNNRAQMQWVSSDVTDQPMYFTFAYLIT